MVLITLFCMAGHLSAQGIQPPAEQSKVIEIEVPTEPWPGWEAGKIEEDPHPPATQPSPDQYESFPTPKGERQSFSGRVTGLKSYQDAEVAVISVFPREYFSHNAYITAMVRPDGSFSMTSQEHPDRMKTICVRVPGHPWTYLNHDFAPNESGRDIVFSVQDGKKITVTVQSDEDQKGWMNLEAFDGYQRHDREGKPVQSEYYGGRDGTNGTASLILPLRPMALRISAASSANSYLLIDPRETDHLTLKLPREAILKGRVTNNGEPMPFKPVWYFNPAARLSWGAAETDAKGLLEVHGLMPGTYLFIIDAKQFTSTLKQGRTNDVTFNLTP